MMLIKLFIFFIFFKISSPQDLPIYVEVKWCTINLFEYKKCQDLVDAINTKINDAMPLPPGYTGKGYQDLPTLKCVSGENQFNCMDMIKKGTADLIQLETSLSYTAGEYYTMMPLMAEKYQPGDGNEGLTFHAVAVINAANANANMTSLKKKKVCMPGVGQAAGWVYPVSYLLENKLMDVAQCDIPVKSAVSFFGDMCAPDGLAKYYNPFGNNPTTICKSCIGPRGVFCTSNDPYAGYSGAMDCLLSGMDVAFVRNTTVAQYIQYNNNSLSNSNFLLLCKDGKKVSLENYQDCSWGLVASHVVMTSTMRAPEQRDDFKRFLNLISLDFGTGGYSENIFKLFESASYGKANLMFSDETIKLKDIAQVDGGTRTTYYSWVTLPELIVKKMDLRSRMIVLNMCPIQQARWCVISPYEMQKCEQMIMAFQAKKLKPDLNCIKGKGAVDCMIKIKNGDVDLITLDAADVYTAGKKYGLVPILAEDYSGKNELGYYAVAVARKRFSFMLINNLKQRRACHSGVYTAAGWIYPVDMLIETGQINVKGCNAYLAVSQYFSKSCVPGILDSYYNPYSTNPVNLCEACSTAGPRRCARSDNELYYGPSGAFRCLTEVGGDIAFVRHMTVRENTDGRDEADWSRNRRSDDYELLCKSGTRTDIDSYVDCNLGYLPSNAVVTAGYKSKNERDVFITMLQYAQQFFDADDNLDFPMFDSYINHRDLIFQDATVQLLTLNYSSQNYLTYLGPEFVRAMQRMESIDCVTGSYASSFNLGIFKIIILFIISLYIYVI